MSTLTTLTAPITHEAPLHPAHCALSAHPTLPPHSAHSTHPTQSAFPARPATLRALAVTAALAAATLLPGTALAQDYGAMVAQSMARMNSIVASSQQQVNGIVQSRMQDPQVRAAYQQHLAQAAQSGRRPMDFPTYTYNYVYTRGFSAAGMAHVRNVEAGNQARELSALQGLRAAQANRGAAQMGQSASFFNNQREAGNQLMGNSTFTAGNGGQTVLPHTWQANTTHTYQGNNYHVDQSGQYWVANANGYWYPLSR